MAKQFMVPMFVLVSADNADSTYDRVTQLQELALKNGFSLLQDELLQPKEVAGSDEAEYHSILDAFSEQELLQPYGNPVASAD